MICFLFQHELSNPALRRFRAPHSVGAAVRSDGNRRSKDLRSALRRLPSFLFCTRLLCRRTAPTAPTAEVARQRGVGVAWGWMKRW